MCGLYNPYTTSHTGRARLHLGKHTRKNLRLMEMYAILAYLRKMASASDAQSCDCKPALQQIENAHAKGCQKV